jgi:hypothetical protein
MTAKDRITDSSGLRPVESPAKERARRAKTDKLIQEAAERLDAEREAEEAKARTKK